MAPTDLTDQTTVSAPTRHRFAAMTTGLVLIVLGSVWLLDALGVVEVRAAMILPLLLAVVGLALIIGSTSGPHPALITLGVFLAVATVFSAVTPPEAFRGGVGDRNNVISNVDDLEGRYELGMGDFTLDLSDLELRESRRVRVSVGLGSMVVDIPADIPVQIEAKVGAGDIDLLGERVDGVALDRTYTSSTYDQADRRLELELEVGAGQIEVK